MVNAQAADIWVTKVVLPGKEDSKKALKPVPNFLALVTVASGMSNFENQQSIALFDPKSWLTCASYCAPSQKPLKQRTPPLRTLVSMQKACIARVLGGLFCPFWGVSDSPPLEPQTDVNIPINNRCESLRSLPCTAGMSSRVEAKHTASKYDFVKVKFAATLRIFRPAW